MKTLAVTVGAALCAVAAFGYDVTVQPGDSLEKIRDGIRADRASGKIAKGEPVTVTFATWAQYGVGKGNNGYFKKRRFYALNVFEELDAPGEWYLDWAAKRLYYYPTADLAGGRSRLALENGQCPLRHG